MSPQFPLINENRKRKKPLTSSAPPSLTTAKFDECARKISLHKSTGMREIRRVVQRKKLKSPQNFATDDGRWHGKTTGQAAFPKAAFRHRKRHAKMTKWIPRNAFTRPYLRTYFDQSCTRLKMQNRGTFLRLHTQNRSCTRLLKRICHEYIESKCTEYRRWIIGTRVHRGEGRGVSWKPNFRNIRRVVGVVYEITIHYLHHFRYERW